MYRRSLSFSLHRSARWTLVVGVLVSLALFAWLYLLEQRHDHARFERRAQARVASVEQGMNNAIDALKVVNQFFIATGNTVTRDEFHLFTQPFLERYPYIEGLSFSRIVTKAERAAFEADIRRRYPGFQITELQNGQRVVAPERESYRVIDYVEPQRRNEIVFGLNGSTVLFLDEPVHRARDFGLPCATGPFPLFSEEGKRLGFRIFMPVYKGGAVPKDVASRRLAIAGYTVAVLRADDLFQKILTAASGALGNADLKIRVYAAGKADEGQLAYSSASQTVDQQRQSYSFGWLHRPANSYAYTFVAADRPWHIVIQAQPSPLFSTHTASLSALLLGMLIAAGATIYLQSAALRGQQVEALVILRTEEIRHLNERLQNDIKVREKAEQALATSEERARDMADMSSDWYWEQDANLRFVNLSSDVMGEKMPPGFVLPPGVLGRTRWELPVDLSASDWDAHRVMLHTHQPFKEFEYRMQLDGIEIEWISATGKPIFDQYGRFKGYRGMAKDITARKRAEEALRQSRADLRRLADHMNQVKEDERKRIARDIHDELGQNLMALRIDVALIGKGLTLPSLANERVDEVLNHIDDTIQSVRAIINDLRPGVLDLGLHAAVEWQTKEFERRTGIGCSLHIDHEEFELDDARTTALFRSVQEALTNILRHANATQVEVELLRKDEALGLRITDNGIGVSPGCRRKANSFGLVGIEERIRMLGGTWSITGNAGQGTSIMFSVPV